MVLYSSKTHDQSTSPQRIEISEIDPNDKNRLNHLFCPFKLLNKYITMHRTTYESEQEQLFIFRDKTPVKPSCVRAVTHEQTHTGTVHKCTVKGCSYSAKDIRYLKIHMKTTHSEVEDYLYPCELCGEKFKFYEQRKRHYNNHH